MTDDRKQQLKDRPHWLTCSLKGCTNEAFPYAMPWSDGEEGWYCSKVCHDHAAAGLMLVKSDAPQREHGFGRDDGYLGPAYCNHLAPRRNGVTVRCSQAPDHEGPHTGMARMWTDGGNEVAQEGRLADDERPDPLCQFCDGDGCRSCLPEVERPEGTLSPIKPIGEMRAFDQGIAVGKAEALRELEGRFLACTCERKHPFRTQVTSDLRAWLHVGPGGCNGVVSMTREDGLTPT